MYVRASAIFVFIWHDSHVTLFTFKKVSYRFPLGSAKLSGVFLVEGVID